MCCCHAPLLQVIYIAPLKALVRERMNDWGRGMCKALGKKLVELTGGGRETLSRVDPHRYEQKMNECVDRCRKWTQFNSAAEEKDALKDRDA
jgi:hypothetical protein